MSHFRKSLTLLPLLVALLCLPQTAAAHFVFLIPVATSDTTCDVYLGFGEGPTAGGTAMLGEREFSPLQIVTSKGTEQRNWQQVDGKWVIKEVPHDALLVQKLEYGIFSRGESSSLLVYYAATGPNVESSAWEECFRRDANRLSVQPAWRDGELAATVYFDGKPAADAEVLFFSDASEVAKETNKQGVAESKLTHGGRWCLRAKYVEAKEGTLGDQDYSQVMHYATVTLDTPRISDATMLQDLPSELAPLDEPITSFGAAVLKDSLFVYGGHFGNAHEYSDEGHSRELLELKLTEGAEWKSVSKGPGLQGLALVTDGAHLYRIGGFSAKNKAGEEQDLWSQTGFAEYDVHEQQWTDLPELPEPRSSFDAATLDGKIYIVGGWTMAGPDNTTWLKTAWKYDPQATEAEWEAIAETPFQRRALAVAAYDHKLFAIGGMQNRGGPTTEVAIYDPVKDAWTEGPAIPGEPMAGFGASAFATGGSLYVSTVDGDLLELSDDQTSWKKVASLPTSRFFHRMLPANDHQLIMVGGANMEIGKFSEVEVIDVPTDK